MVAFPLGQRLTLTPAALVALALGVAAAAALFVLPAPWLESVVLDSGIAAFVPNAEPPLGLTARVVLAIGAAVVVAGLGWAVTTVLPSARRTPHFAPDFVSDAAETLPVLRRADSHPDAPARAPLMATRDLGTPFLDVKAKDAARLAKPVPKPMPTAPIERDIPRDLDAPLSAFDPAAIPYEPAAPVPVVASLVKLVPALDEGERFESFELPRPAPLPVEERPIATPRTDETIHALLERLERGLARREEAVTPAAVPVVEVQPEPVIEPAPEPVKPTLVPQVQGLQDTLSELRRLATR